MGLPELRSRLSELHCAKGQDIMVTSGGNNAFTNVAFSLIKPGDTAILVAPYYFSHKAALILAGATVVTVGYHPLSKQPDVEDLRRALLLPSVRCCVITTPNNPSGVVYTSATLGAISEACAEKGVFMVVDEAYDGFKYETSQPCPNIDGSMHAIRIGTFSKKFGMAGWRVGYICHPEILTPLLVKVQDAITTHPSMISQDLALSTLKLPWISDWVAERVHGLRVPREAAWEAVADSGATKTTGAYFFLVPLPSAWQSSEMDAITVLAERYQVLVAPGSAFGAPGHFRLSYGSHSDEVFSAAAQRLRLGLAYLSAASPPKPPVITEGSLHLAVF